MLNRDEGTIKNYIQLGSTTDDSLLLAAGQSITISNRRERQSHCGIVPLFLFYSGIFYRLKGETT